MSSQSRRRLFRALLIFTALDLMIWAAALSVGLPSVARYPGLSAWEVRLTRPGERIEPAEPPAMTLWRSDPDRLVWPWARRVDGEWIIVF